MKTAALALVSCAASVSAFMPAAVSPFAPRILSAAAPAADAPVDQPLETNTILVFEDKNGGDHLALVTDSMSKAKGGRRYSLTTADGKSTTCGENQISMVVPGGGKWKNKDLGAFEKMHDAAIAKPASVVDPEVMQLAWDELVDDKQEISMSALLELMDGDKPDPKQVYSAFVAFTSSDYGRLFFTMLKKGKNKAMRFKVKARKQVKTGMEAYCSSHDGADICMVAY